MQTHDLINFSSAGGGGERTLFSAIKSVKQKYPKSKLILCIKAKTRNQQSIDEIKKKALVMVYPALDACSNMLLG